MGLIKLLATFFIIYLAFRLIIMYILPPIVKWQLFRYKKKFYEQNPHLRKDEPQKTKQKPSDQIGEYVDFEDIKEDKK